MGPRSQRANGHTAENLPQRLSHHNRPKRCGHSLLLQIPKNARLGTPARDGTCARESGLLRQGLPGHHLTAATSSSGQQLLPASRRTQPSDHQRLLLLPAAAPAQALNPWPSRDGHREMLEPHLPASVSMPGTPSSLCALCTNVQFRGCGKCGTRAQIVAALQFAARERTC